MENSRRPRSAFPEATHHKRAARGRHAWCPRKQRPEIEHPLSTILIVDDQAVGRAAASDLFESHSGFGVCGEAENGADAISKAPGTQARPYKFSTLYAVMNRFDAGKILRETLPEVPTFLLTAYHIRAREGAAFDVGKFFQNSKGWIRCSRKLAQA